jgi:hypothetical protein
MTRADKVRGVFRPKTNDTKEQARTCRECEIILHNRISFGFLLLGAKMFIISKVLSCSRGLLTTVSRPQRRRKAVVAGTAL